MAYRIYLVYENVGTGKWTCNEAVAFRWPRRSTLTYYVVAPNIATAVATAAQRCWFDPEISTLQAGIAALKNGECYHYPIGRWSTSMPFYPFDRFKTVLRLLRHMRWYAQHRLDEPNEDLFRPIVASLIDALNALESAPIMAYRFAEQRYQIVPVGPDEPFHMYRLMLAEPDGHRIDRVRLVPEENVLRGTYLTDIGGLTLWRPVGSRKRTNDPVEEHRFLIELAIRTILDGREFFFGPIISTGKRSDRLVWQTAQSGHRRSVTNRGPQRV